MISNRHLKRLIKNEKEKYVDRFMNVEIGNMDNTSNNENDCYEIEDADLVETETEQVEELECNSNAQESQNLSISQKLKEWNVKHRPSRSCVKDLIEILREENIVVTPFYKFHCPNRPIVENIAGGAYMHIGLSFHLKRIAEVLNLPTNIIIDINVDGLPLFRSSKTQLWPILIRITNVESQPVFPIGVFVGKSKPATCEEFLSRFIDEVSPYLGTGIELNGRKISIRAVLCDAPARAFITGTPSHASRHGCSKCTQRGKKCEGTLTYSTTSEILISDEDFRVYFNTNTHMIDPIMYMLRCK